MHRTDGANHSSNMFVDKVPGVSPGTIVEKNWLNAVQEEICTFIEGRGVTLVKGTNNQLATALAAVPSRTTATLAAGWTGGVSVPKYFKDSAGNVHLQGSAAHSTDGELQTMFTLPSGFRPTASVFFPAVKLPTAPVLCGLLINTAGEVIVSGPAGTDQIFLDSVTFHP